MFPWKHSGFYILDTFDEPDVKLPHFFPHQLWRFAWTGFRFVICERRHLASCCVTVNSGSRCIVGRNNRKAGPPPGSDPCHRNNNKNCWVLELWKYEVTKGALCVGIDVLQGWHCAPSRGWSSSQDQMPELGQGEKEKEDTKARRGGRGLNNKYLHLDVLGASFSAAAKTKLWVYQTDISSQ